MSKKKERHRPGVSSHPLVQTTCFQTSLRMGSNVQLEGLSKNSSKQLLFRKTSQEKKLFKGGCQSSMVDN